MRMKSLILAVGMVLSTMSAKAADTYVIVLDASGSMDDAIDLRNGTRMDKMTVAKNALSQTLLRLPQDAKLGILVFSAANLDSSQEWVYPVGPINRAKLLTAIALPRPDGGTPLGEYLKKGADELLQQREKNKNYGNYTLVAVTDGAANDQSYVEQYVPLIQARGIRVNVIGLAMEADAFLAQHASLYQSADDPTSLTAALTKAVAEVPTGKDGQVDPSWFDEIQPLPDEAAKAALTTMVNVSSQNQPIGETPKVATVISDEGQVTTQPVTETAEDANSGSGLVLTILGGVVILVVCVGMLLMVITMIFQS